MGDELLASRSRASLDESLMTTSSIPSQHSIDNFNRIQASRRGRGLLISGGAPLHPEVAWSLRLLQVDAMKRYDPEI